MCLNNTFFSANIEREMREGKYYKQELYTYISEEDFETSVEHVDCGKWRL